MMQKGERLRNALAGADVDRLPVAIWRHWPGDDQRPADFARCLVGFQRAYDWDFINVTPFSAYMTADYGVHTMWQADMTGDRAIIKRALTRSIEWTELRTLDAGRGVLAKTLEAVHLVDDALGTADDPPPIIVSIPSPLTQAGQIAGHDLLLRHIRTAPDRVRTGLSTITDSVLRFMAELRRESIAGIHYTMDYASFDRLSADEYRAFGEPFDRQILSAMPDKWWLNILQLPATAPMFDLAVTYALPVIQYDMTLDDLSRARVTFDGVLCGGTTASQLNMESPTAFRDTARRIALDMNRRRMILSASAPVMVCTPRANLRAVREIVEE
ncbi:MAG: hypothetical protein EA396_09010 [Anaerolineaceae bacterium]|nr:MAG: hypothetical protein EA396_09010 [Anaerolineaceae bacterium]